ncbi:MAG TPA: TIGR03086 family metal-binding protein [Chloroflexota bacterium]|jgi:uncharacterized protein (TIGR03086 family)
MVEDRLRLLERALDGTGTVLERIRPEDQASAPTPCTQWNLRQLVNHVVVDVQQFTRMAAGARYEPQQGDVIGDDWLATYRAASRELIAAWQRPGALDQIAHMPFGDVPADWQLGQQMTDLAVHAWDLARAGGLAPRMDDEVVEASLEWGRANLKPEFRGATFGSEVDVPPSAPTYDRLVGFFGRRPDWQPSGSAGA